MRRLLVAVVVVGVALGCARGVCGLVWNGRTSVDRPDVVTGPQVHAVVALPSDAPDTFVQDANTLSDDVTSLTSWWQGQDPTRIPRFDLATFPGGTCLDISFVRLPDPATAYTGVNVAFQLVAGQLFSGGMGNPFKKYLVYYPGPSPASGICGTGAGDFAEGPGYAVVWLQGCPNVPSDAVAAHELLHALGALPAGAPNVCTPATDPVHVADKAHPCDSPTDVLYPVLHRGRAAHKPRSGLQPRRLLRAFGLMAGHPGLDLDASPRRCTGATGRERHGDSCWERHEQRPGRRLREQLHEPVGPGVGGGPEGDAGRGRALPRLVGSCVGSSTCSLTLQTSQTATALFGPATIAVKVSTAGKGTVYCVPRCSRTFKAGAPLKLTAQPAKGWTFVRWSGACTGTQPICRPQTNRSLSAKATFRKKPVPKKR